MLANSRLVAILPVVDIERARAFYEETLGLQAIDVDDGVIYECGQGTQLALYQRDTPTKADHTAVAWVVDNIEEAAQALREKGVVFEQYDMPGIKTDEREIATMETIKQAWFKDPGGNILTIAEFG